MGPSASTKQAKLEPMFETPILLCGEGSNETARGGRPSHESVASLIEAGLSRPLAFQPNKDLREKRGKSSELEGFLLLGGRPPSQTQNVVSRF